MNLIIDAGNTLLKWAVFEQGILLHDEAVRTEHFTARIRGIFEKYPGIGHAIVSSVGQLDEKGLEVLKVFCRVHVLGLHSRVPFKNLYATPRTLGTDRIALATAAFYYRPNGNVLVLDAGTCLTFDMVNDQGEYLGGAISPGLSMRYVALHRQTSKLPLLEAADVADFIGNTTETSMHSGVVNGLCHEMDGVINQYRSRFGDLTVILTGGDGQFLSKRLKNTIFAHSKFLLLGLNYLLEYNKR